jgi:NADH-ubiquinone oxidoreductase chain 5
MYISLIFLPLLGCIFSGLLGRKTGVTGSHLITCTGVLISTALVMLVFIEVGLNSIPVNINLFK